MQHFTSQQFNEFDKKFRINFFNSLSGFRSVNLIGTQNLQNQLNVAIFSSIVHVGSNPPYYGLIFRPSKGFQRHTLENILETQFFTINQINKTIFHQAHQTSAKYNRDESEFEATGLSPYFSDHFFAPYVKESNIKYGLQFIEKHELINGTTFLVGKVEEVILNENILQQDGMLDLEAANTITSSGLDNYHSTQLIETLEQARI